MGQSSTGDGGPGGYEEYFRRIPTPIVSLMQDITHCPTVSSPVMQYNTTRASLQIQQLFSRIDQLVSRTESLISRMDEIQDKRSKHLVNNKRSSIKHQELC